MPSGKESKSEAAPTTLSTEEQLSFAIEALAELVVLFDAEDRIVLANAAWRDLNKEVEETTRPGVKFEDHLHALLAKQLIPEAIGREEDWLRERMERHRNPTGSFELARQNGKRTRVFEQRLPNGGTILILSDITDSKLAERALRESEERFRAVVNNSPTKIHIKDAEGRYLLINDLAGQLFGFTEETALGKSTYELFPKDKANAFAAHDQMVMDSGKAVEQEEEWRRGDCVHTFLTVKFPIYGHAGNVTGVGAIGTDITDRKKVEAALRESEAQLQERIAELEQAQRRLERQGADLVRLAADLKVARDQAETASRAKSEFLATMSHELRTPLNAIIGFSEIMMAERLGPIGTASYRDYAQDINDSGLHLLSLINDILDLSKVESGLDELHEVNIDVQEMVDAVVRLVNQRARIGSVTLEHRVSKTLPWFFGDERKLKQILVNLLTNAIKFTDTGGTVSLDCQCDQEGRHVFAVADTGIGIAENDIPKAMSQFGQVDSAFNRKHEGTGLGLPLTKALVELHGGTMELKSKVGAGTTVTLCFPATRNVARADAALG
jgi:two-component system cell cycle sensor histidine kinase PleC